MPFQFDLRTSLRSRSTLHTHVCKKQAQPISRMLLFTCVAFAAATATSCSVAGSGAPAPPEASVTVQPNTAQLFIGEKMHFAANVQNASNSTVNWTIQQASGTNQDLGSIDSSGNYLAPAALPSPSVGTVTVIASLQADPTVSGSASVSLQTSLSISPARAGVTTSQQLALAVVTPGVTPSDVTWSVVPSGSSSAGTIVTTANGATYTPPATAGAFTVMASLNANPNVTGQATVYVTDFPGTFTWRNDNQRSGINSQELALSPATVTASTFGKLFSCPVDGYIYAQPLYVASLKMGSETHNAVFVATENDSVYAFDADASPCRQLWKTSLIPPGEQIIHLPISPQVPTTLLGPLMGVTGTPVIDMESAAPSLYVMAATLLPPSATDPLNPTYSYRLYPLDPTTGGLLTKGVPVPFNISGFNAISQLQRSALLLDGGHLYVAFGSNNSPNVYHGWLLEFDSTSLAPTATFSVTLLGLDSPGGGIWQSGGGPAADANHNVFVDTGDGPPNGPAGTGFNYSDSVLRMNAQAGLSVADYFTPCDQGVDWPSPSSFSKSQSSAPLLLPDSVGSPSQPHLLISASKEGFLYVIDRDSMGQFPSSCLDEPPRVQTVPVGGPVLSTPIFWNDSIFVAPGQANSSQISHLMSLPMAQGVLSSSPTSLSSEKLGLGPQVATPVISASGANKAVLWLIDSRGAFAAPNGPAILRAYDPNDLSNELYDSAQAPKNRDQAGPAVKFTVPTVANGKVYVGTQSELDVYGLLP